MRLELPRCQVRSPRPSDAPSLARYANNRAIWLNLRDAFPHPYTREDAERFIATALDQDPEQRFVIEVDGEVVGCIGLGLHPDVERVSAEIGYWIAEPFWNRGIATDALRGLTAYAFARLPLTRIFAVPFEWNTASCRVLEKAGYTLECRMRRSAIKDGRVVDQFLYAFVPSPETGEQQCPSSSGSPTT